MKALLILAMLVMIILPEQNVKAEEWKLEDIMSAIEEAYSSEACNLAINLFTLP